MLRKRRSCNFSCRFGQLCLSFSSVIVLYHLLAILLIGPSALKINRGHSLRIGYYSSNGHGDDDDDDDDVDNDDDDGASSRVMDMMVTVMAPTAFCCTTSVSVCVCVCVKILLYSLL